MGIKIRNDAEREEFKEAIRQGKPYKLQEIKLHLTKRCNLNCAMCGGSKKSNEPTLEEVRTILDEAKGLGLVLVKYFGGEPTLKPDLEEMIRYASQLGVQSNITTNGTLIDESRAKSLIEAGLGQVIVSIDSPYPEKHDSIRGKKGVYDKATHAIELLVANSEASGVGTKVCVNTVVMRHNYRDLPLLVKNLADMGVNLMSFNPVTPNNAEAMVDSKERRFFLDLSLTPEEAKEYQEDIVPQIVESAGETLHLDVDRLYFYGENECVARREPPFLFIKDLMPRATCLKPFYYATITQNLGVVACNHVKGSLFPIGSLKEQSLAGLWNSTAYNQFRETIRDEYFPECQFCCYPLFYSYMQKCAKESVKS